MVLVGNCVLRCCYFVVSPMGICSSPCALGDREGCSPYRLQRQLQGASCYKTRTAVGHPGECARLSVAKIDVFFLCCVEIRISTETLLVRAAHPTRLNPRAGWIPQVAYDT